MGTATMQTVPPKVTTGSACGSVPGAAAPLLSAAGPPFVPQGPMAFGGNLASASEGHNG